MSLKFIQNFILDDKIVYMMQINRKSQYFYLIQSND